MEELYEAGRRYGIRLAQPFCDLDVLALRYRARPEDLDRGGRPKGIVREAVGRRFPLQGLIHERAATGRNLFTELVSRDVAPRLLHSVGVAALGELGIVDPARFEAAVARGAGSRDQRSASRIWDTLILERWGRAHS
jgi:hypothetical protein